jgi:hypothetical protein
MRKMSTRTKKSPVIATLRKHPKRAPTSKTLAGKRLGRKPKIVQSDKAKDQAERAKIAGTFDAAAFEATEDQISAQTAKDWSIPY